MARPASQRAARWLALLGVNVFAALCFVGIKLGLAYAPPLLFGGLRALLAGAVLLAVAAAAGQPVRPARADLPTLLLLALTATTATYGAMFASPSLMDAGLASVLGNVQPLVLLVLGAVMLGEPLTRRRVLALIGGITGVALILTPSLRGALRGSGMGPVLALMASVGAALGGILFKRARQRPGVVAITGWQLAIGSGPLLLAAGLWPAPAPVRWTAAFWGILVALAVFGTALPTTLWFWLLQNEDAGKLGVFLFLIPVLGLLLGAVVFGERVGPLQAGGVLAIAGGILAVAREKAQPTRSGAKPQTGPAPNRPRAT